MCKKCIWLVHCMILGKMAVGNEILEKPDKLTDDEFSKMKNHAGYTYLILSEVNDFEEKYEIGQLSIMKIKWKRVSFWKNRS